MTEAIYSFIGFLSTREKPLIFSSKHDCAPIAQVAAEFVKVNRMPATRPDWPKYKAPTNVDHLTNEKVAEPPTKAIAASMNKEDAIGEIKIILSMVSRPERNTVLAAVLDYEKEHRQYMADHSRVTALEAELDARNYQDDLLKLESILRGDVAVINHKSQLNGQ